MEHHLLYFALLSYHYNQNVHGSDDAIIRVLFIEFAKRLGIEGTSAYVRVSQLKKQAVDKLIENVDHSQVIDYL